MSALNQMHVDLLGFGCRYKDFTGVPKLVKFQFAGLCY